VNCFREKFGKTWLYPAPQNLLFKEKLVYPTPFHKLTRCLTVLEKKKEKQKCIRTETCVKQVWSSAPVLFLAKFRAGHLGPEPALNPQPYTTGPDSGLDVEKNLYTNWV
jgi:hypothetical protein